MLSPKSLVGALLVAPVALVAAADPQCDCYVTNGTKPTYYSGHMFFDFRSLSKYASVPEILASQEANAKADFTSPYFNWESGWAKTWGAQKWANSNKKFPMQNTYNNLYIERNDDPKPLTDTWLTMRTARLPGFQTASEFESIQKYNFASMRMYARTSGSPGACTAMFTYRAGEKLAQVQEADIEVLTKDSPDTIHYTNQPSYTDKGGDVPGASRTVKLSKGMRWDQWLTHRIDWTPGQTIYSANGIEQAAISFQTPKDPATLTFNSWSNGDTWTGKMEEGGIAYQQIQWIEILHTLTDKASCKRVCSIDKAKTIGKPVPIGGNSGGSCKKQ